MFVKWGGGGTAHHSVLLGPHLTEQEILMVSSAHQSPEFDDYLESIPCLPDPVLVQLLPEHSRVNCNSFPD